MKRFTAFVAAALVATSAQAQILPGATGLPAGTDLSAATVTATGGVSARSLALRSTDFVNANNFGALGNGTSTTIGTTYGASLSAVAAYTTTAGATPFSWMTNAAYGLTFAMNTSAAQGSAGPTLTFQTTVSGINGWSATIASFNGLPAKQSNVVVAGMTVTGSCIAVGTTVSSFAISTGVITLSQSTSSACGSGTAITFTASNAQVQALQVDYMGIESAVAAANAQGGGTVRIPDGHYIVNHTIYNPGITNANQLSPQVDIVGSGQYDVRLDFTSDLGSGACAIAESNRGPSSVGRNRYSGFWIYGPGTVNTIGNAVAGMDGLCPGAKGHIDHVNSLFFHAGVSLVEDHGIIDQSDLSENFYGVYFAQNGDTVGNWAITNTYMVGEAWAGIGVAWNNSIAAATIKNVDVGGNSPYSFYRETVPGGQTIVMAFITASTIDSAFGESLGQGYIYGENTADNVNYNTFINEQPVGNLGNASALISGRAVKAVMYAGNFQNNVLINSDFSYGSINASSVADAIFEVQGGFSNNDLGNQDTMMAATLAKPIVTSPNAGFTTNNSFKSPNYEGRIGPTESAVTIGQVMTCGTVYYACYGGKPNVIGALPTGVALKAGGTFTAIPILTRGLAVVPKLTGTAIGIGQPVCISSATPTSVVSCTVANGGAVVGNVNTVAALTTDTTAAMFVNLAGAPAVVSTATALTAAGTTQGTALVIPASTNQFSTVASGAGGILTIAPQGAPIIVYNDGANALLVYPQSGGTINALAANTGFSIAAGASATFRMISSTAWHT